MTVKKNEQMHVTPAPGAFEIAILQGKEAENGDMLAAACRQIFADFEENYLRKRLDKLTDPVLVAARDGNDLVAFKLAYRRGDTLLYSWLGGVHPAVRKRGLGSQLMAVQHDWARDAGYRIIETRTRATNNPMILLNLRHGFEICGYEVDARGVPVVTQRMLLNPRS